MIGQELEEKLKPIFEEIQGRLLTIENQCYLGRKNHQATLLALGKLINELEITPYAHLMKLDLKATQQICTRVASLYMFVLTDFSAKINADILFLLTAQKRFMLSCFEISGFGSNEMLVSLLRKRAAETRKTTFTANEAALRQTLASTSTDLKPEELVDLSLEESHEAAVLTLGLLLERAPISLQGEGARKFLQEEYKPWAKLQPIDAYRHVVANVWMLCSYSTSPTKHLIKKELNQWFKRIHQSKQLKTLPKGSVKHKGNVENKPVMAVPMESFISVHAMYRWYAPIFKSLKKRYYLVLIALPADVDEVSKELFDEFIEVPADELGIQPVLNACTPDLVYYPSLGMRAWSISLCNLRWAPLQLMTLGHPATSFSEFVDGVIFNERTFGGKGLFTENQMLMKSDVGDLIEAHRDMTLPEPVELPSDVIKIAVPCNVMKLNIQFISALQEITRLANKPVQFTFFPNEFGLSHLSITKKLRNFFPNCEVPFRVPYSAYLEMLNKHHFALSTFPFGNATSSVDCLVLNLPYIALVGQEAHSRTDYDILANFGLAEYCAAESIENFVMGAVNWINNPEVLAEMKEILASKDFLGMHLAKGGQGKMPEEFADVVDWAFEHQDELTQTRGEVFTAEGRWLPEN